MKKIISLILVIALCCSISVGLTVAYLTDRDSEVNVFTVGDVSIDLDETFQQGVQLLPGVTIEKKPAVTNTGKNDAWVWTTVAVPGSLADVIDFGNEGDGWDWDNVIKQENVKIDDKFYTQYTILHTAALAPEEVTANLFESVTLSSAVDIDPNGQWYKVVNGSPEDLGWNNSDGDPMIYVSAYAIQTEGFNDAKEAYEAYQAQWGTGDAGQEWGEPTPVADSADDLIEALQGGDDVIFDADIKISPANMSNAYGTTGINVQNGQAIYGNGNTLDIKGAGGIWDSGINTTGGLIKDLTITGSFRGVFINHNSDYSERVVLDNVTIEGTTYTISCDQGKNQGLTATNSTFKGWTSYAGTLGDAKFFDCYFGRGNGYAYMRPYAPTEFVGCEFEAGFQMDARAAVTFENCTIGGVALTADNLDTLVTSNIANATVK